MNDVVLASSEADLRAAEAIEQHHARLAADLAALVQATVSAAAGGDQLRCSESRQQLVDWARRELVPHALAEEQTLYPAAQHRGEARLLVDGMLDEHRWIVDLVDEVETEPEPVPAAAAARALLAMFESHLVKENELLLPVLSGAPDVALSNLLAEMESDFDEERGHQQATGESGHHCSCGETDAAGLPELDARTIPHAIRHATIFGALDGVGPGGGIILTASHNPLPLLAQLEQRAPGAFTVEYLEEGPETWRLALVRA
jgi:uncharacterized protein (DUF2249 family)/iron-sulfur cluster repair protein YtfE (RIC family)